MRTAGAWLVALVAACSFGDNTGHRTDTQVSCGNGIVDPGEGCDDGNRASGDGCSDTCAVETDTPVCGNGIKEASEECDDGNLLPGDTCSPTCEVTSLCGNGRIDPGEECDDENTASGDGCSPTCQVEQTGACALFPQGGCSGNTPACDLTEIEDGSTECRAVTVAGTSDSRCAARTACAPGYTCVGDIGVDSACMPFCADDADCQGVGSRCAFGLVNDNADPLGVSVCSNACSLVAQTGCPSGMGCLGFEASSGDYTDCRVMGTTNVGGSCQASTDCRPGMLCVDVSGSARCYAYCRTSLDCGVLEDCVPFASTLTIGGDEYGFCY